MLPTRMLLLMRLMQLQLRRLVWFLRLLPVEAPHQPWGCPHTRMSSCYTGAQAFKVDCYPPLPKRSVVATVTSHDTKISRYIVLYSYTPRHFRVEVDTHVYLRFRLLHCKSPQLTESLCGLHLNGT
ncbi:hypothetical protein EDD15DRAFT_2308050 [Pisolithus albus]|nr:hypothetical protein EDD15DRAFT_2308050 [Pisolithus albus]